MAHLLSSDVSVLTSKTEGISNSIIESMACGTPVIATSKGGTAEIIENGINGYIERYQDYKAIAARIIELKNNSQLYNNISKNAINSIKERFEINSMIIDFEKILSEVLNDE